VIRGHVRAVPRSRSIAPREVTSLTAHDVNRHRYGERRSASSRGDVRVRIPARQFAAAAGWGSPAMARRHGRRRVPFPSEGTRRSRASCAIVLARRADTWSAAASGQVRQQRPSALATALDQQRRGVIAPRRKSRCSSPRRHRSARESRTTRATNGSFRRGAGSAPSRQRACQSTSTSLDRWRAPERRYQPSSPSCRFAGLTGDAPGRP
jgi:hypothetical protein